MGLLPFPCVRTEEHSHFLIFLLALGPWFSFPEELCSGTLRLCTGGVRPTDSLSVEPTAACFPLLLADGLRVTDCSLSGYLLSCSVAVASYKCKRLIFKVSEGSPKPLFPYPTTAAPLEQSPSPAAWIASSALWVRTFSFDFSFAVLLLL